MNHADALLLALLGAWLFMLGCCLGRYIHHRAWCSTGTPIDHNYSLKKAYRDWKELP